MSKGKGGALKDHSAKQGEGGWPGTYWTNLNGPGDNKGHTGQGSSRQEADAHAYESYQQDHGRDK